MGVLVALSLVLPLLTSCSIYDSWAEDTNSGSVAFSLDGDALEVLVGVCQVQPSVIHFSTRGKGPGGWKDVAVWVAQSGVDEGVTRVSGKDSPWRQTLGPERLSVPTRSVLIWAEPANEIKMLPQTVATPARLRTLAPNEVLTADVNGKPLVMKKSEYQNSHCLGPSD